MLLLKLLWRASVSTWAWTPSQTSALHRPAPPVPSNQSTFLINCIQIGRHLLERASEKTCFPPRLFWARCYFCLQTKAHYPHTVGALSKENTQTRGSQTFDFVFLRPCSQWKKKKKTHLRAIWWIRRINCAFWRNVCEEWWQIYGRLYWKADSLELCVEQLLITTTQIRACQPSLPPSLQLPHVLLQPHLSSPQPTWTWCCMVKDPNISDGCILE